MENKIKLYEFFDQNFNKKFNEWNNFLFECCKFLEEEEGFKRDIYLCTSKKKTTGIGIQVKFVKKYIGGWHGFRRLRGTEVCYTCQQYIIDNVFPVISNFVKYPLNKNQTIALVSLVYNVGATCFVNSRCLKRLNEGDLKGFEKEYDFGKHQGLMPRRLRELKKFYEPIK